MNRSVFKRVSRRRGLSIIELLVVVAIILIVISIVIAVLAKVWHVVESFRH